MTAPSTSGCSTHSIEWDGPFVYHTNESKCGMEGGNQLWRLSRLQPFSPISPPFLEQYVFFNFRLWNPLSQDFRAYVWFKTKKSRDESFLVLSNYLLSLPAGPPLHLLCGDRLLSNKDKIWANATFSILRNEFKLFSCWESHNYVT